MDGEQPGVCDLCGHGQPRLNRLFGLDVCDPCRLSPVGRVGAWAAVEVVDERQHFPPATAFQVTGGQGLGGVETASVQSTKIVASGDVALPTVKFSSETLGWLKRLFVREVQVGDPVFDDAVWVSARDRREAARLLGIEGVQSAVLEAVSNDAALRIEGNQVFVERYGDDEYPPGELAVLALSIIAHARPAPVAQVDDNAD